MSEEPLFPSNIEGKAFRLGQEHAWQKTDIEAVFGYCIEANIAIIGGEAWVVRKIAELTPEEPFERNLDPRYRQDVTVSAQAL